MVCQLDDKMDTLKLENRADDIWSEMEKIRTINIAPKCHFRPIFENSGSYMMIVYLKKTPMERANSSLFKADDQFHTTILITCKYGCFF